MGKPLAARAVGNACGSNPVAIVVPCHRVVASDGGLGGFGWGLDRKRLLLDNEHAADIARYQLVAASVSATVSTSHRWVVFPMTATPSSRSG